MKKYFKLIKNKNFIYSYLSMLISSFGDSLSLLAFPLFAFNATGSAKSAGIIMLAETIPWIIIAPLVGKYIDKGDKKKFLLIGDLIRAIATLSIVFTDNMLIIYFLVFVNGACSSVFSNSKSAMTTEILNEDELELGLNISNITKQTINIVGPAIGTIILIAISSKILFLIDAITYIISFLFNSKITICSKSNQDSNNETSIDSIKNSILYISKNYEILYSLFIDCITTIFEAIISIVLVVFIKETLKFSDSIYALVITINTMGLMVGFGLLIRIENKFNSIRILKLVGFLVSVIFLMNIFSTNIIFICIIWFIYGIIIGIREMMIQLIFMKRIEDSKKGRVFSVANSIISLSYIIGFSLTGYLIDQFGTLGTFIFCAVFSSVLLLVIEIVNLKIYKGKLEKYNG